MITPIRSRLSVASVLLLMAIDSRADGAPVAVITPKQVVVTEKVQLTGTLTAERRARLSPRVDGLVARMRVDAGDRVKAGQALLELDADLATHSLRAAEADAAQAKARVTEAQRLVSEARRLVGERHLPQTELERRESELLLAQAALQSADAARQEQAEQVRRHVLPAPFAGVIADRFTDVGEWVTRGTEVLDLVATDRVRLDVRAPQEHFARIAEQAEVEIRTPGNAGRLLSGRIIARVPIGDDSARTFLVRILIEDPGSALLPGSSATAYISLRGSEPAFAVPRDALLRYPDGTHSAFVIVRQEGKTIVRERRVTIGRGAQEVEILDGLRAGEQVVVRGNESLRDGQAVTITRAAEQSGS